MASIVDAVNFSRRRARRAPALLLLPLVMLVAVTALAVGYVAYVLWPRWPGPQVALDAPELPIVIGEVTFDVPPAAIRIPVQRRAGVQQRLDLAFLWPSLTPPGEGKPAATSPGETLHPIDRIFVTVAVEAGTLDPVDRLKTIYPRYLSADPQPAADGLVAYSFREGTPYQGEDLIYDVAHPAQFFVRCTRDGPGPVPGICLAEVRLRQADLTARFPRDWLTNWRDVVSGIGRLIGKLKPH